MYASCCMHVFTTLHRQLLDQLVTLVSWWLMPCTLYPIQHCSAHGLPLRICSLCALCTATPHSTAAYIIALSNALY
jgi:hypothetical protein